jgi:hypothetical protein
VEKYRANELIHGRWAMLAAAGIIIPEGLQVRRLFEFSYDRQPGLAACFACCFCLSLSQGVLVVV